VPLRISFPLSALPECPFLRFLLRSGDAADKPFSARCLLSFFSLNFSAYHKKEIL
jgi:hypothetical protein